MKVAVKQDTYTIDQDTGLPIDILREQLLEAKNSPASKLNIEEIKTQAKKLRNQYSVK